MATNAVFPYTETKTEVWTLDATTAPGTFVMQNGTPAVTLTGTSDYSISTTIGELTISGIGRGGASLEGKEATVCTDGTWELSVAGANGTQVQNTPVFAKADGTLTLTATDATKVGKVNLPRDYAFTGAVLPVKIGVNA